MYNILYSFMLTLSKLNKKINQLFLIDLIYNLYLEATPGFEPGIRVLQTRALATWLCRHLINYIPLF